MVVGSTKITIPGQKKANELILLGSWLLFWLLVLALILMIFYQMVSGAYQEGNFLAFCILIPLMLLSILSWGVHGILGIYLFFWQIAGLETIEASRTALKIRRTIFGIGRTKEYERDKIISISLGGPDMMPFAFLKFKSTQFQLPITGPVIVNVKIRDREVAEHLGLGLRQDQAERVIALLRQRLFPDKAPLFDKL
jgi:hypothetical protein